MIMSEAFVILNYSRVIRAVQYNSENDSWTTWLSTLKKDIPKVSKDAKSLFKELDSGKLKVTDWQGYCNSVKMTDETLISFLQDTKYGTKDLASYQQYLKESSQSMTLFQRAGKAAGTAVKSLVATAGSMLVSWGVGEVISLIVKPTYEFYISTKTLNDLCQILQYDICDIVQYVPSDTDQPL